MIRILEQEQNVPITRELLQAWIHHTWLHAKENGWEPFVIYTYDSWGRPTEYVQKPGAMFHAGNWVYQGTISELQPNGVLISKQDASALSRQRWSPTYRNGTRPDLYEEFEERYRKTYIPLKSKL